MSIQPIELNHILLPYDFSENAQIALQHTVSLARKIKAKVTILHVKEPHAAGQYVSRDPDFKSGNYDEVALKKMEEAALPMKVLGVKVDCITREGKIFKVVEQVVREEQISMVIIGTHGAKGRDSFFLGSNAYKVVNHLKVPVLTVQMNATDPEYKKVFLPLDETFHTREKIPYGKLFAGIYNAELSLTGLQKHHDKDSIKHLSNILGQAEHYVSDQVSKVSKHMHDSKNNAADTLKYAEEQNADLIVIMSEQEKTLSGFFLGPYAQQVVSAAKIPVLIVPPKVSMVMTNVSI